MAIAFVRQAVNATTASTTCAVTITAPTAGNCLVACIYSDSGLVSGISGGGVTWAKLKAGNFASFSAEIWYGLNSSGSGTTVTVTNAVSGVNCVNVSEFSGIKTSGAADASTAASNGPAANPSVGPITAAAGPCLYIASLSLNQNGTTGPGDGFTALTDAASSFKHALGCYRIDTSPAAATPSWTQGSGSYDMAVGALLGAVPATIRANRTGLVGVY